MTLNLVGNEAWVRYIRFPVVEYWQLLAANGRIPDRKKKQTNKKFTNRLPMHHVLAKVSK